MFSALKSELRKIYTVRSTYAVLIFCFLLMILFAFWANGIKAGTDSAPVTNPDKLADLIRQGVTFLAFFGSIVSILLITSEYRHNTIFYTLTQSRSRTKTLLAKVVAASLFSVFFTVFVAVFASALMYLGITIKGLSLGHQTIPLDLIWRVFYLSWGYSMFGLLVAALIRQQVGALAVFFAFPAFIEQLLGLLLKDNAIYLPFTALQQVTMTQGMQHTALSHGKAAFVVCIYLVVGWILAWILFLRRDAN